MTEHDIDQLACALVEKTRILNITLFTDEQSKTLVRFADVLADSNGWKKFQALLDFGSFILIWRKTAMLVIATGIVTGLGSLLVFGVKHWITLAGK